MVLVDLTRGNDVVTVVFEQSGSHQSKITLKDRLLDERLQYLVGVTELTLPLSQTRMLSNKIANYDLLTLKRRHVGADITVVANTNIVTVRPDLLNYGTLTINPARVPYLNTAGAFLKHVVNWMSILDQKYRIKPPLTEAIEPLQHGNQTLVHQGVSVANPFGMALFHFHFDPSGFLVINGTPRGWNNFYFEVSPFGRELLGFDTDKILVTKNAITNAYETDTASLTLNNIIVVANMDIPVVVKAKQSIFRTLEHRVSINIESSLPTEQQLLLSNGKEKIHTYLESFTFENIFNVRSIDFQHEIIAKSFVGKHRFRGSNDPCQNWTKLTEFYDLRNINLTLSITRREWDEATNKWGYLTNKFPIEKDARWSCALKFVSTS